MSAPEPEIRVGPVEEGDLEPVSGLLRRSYPKVRYFDVPFLRWQYLSNPAGVSLAAHAWSGKRLVGHAGFSPLRASLYGAIEPGLLVHTVATDPGFAGRGVFTRLLAAGVEAAQARGSGFIVAVPNDGSVGAFVERNGFRSLGPMPARLGPRRPKASTALVDADFERIFTPEELRWRLARPGARYGLMRAPGGARIEVATGTLGIRAEMACVPSRELAELDDATLRPLRGWRLPAYLGIGFEPGGRLATRDSFDLPLWLRPAPLHFVYRDLCETERAWSSGRVRFRLLDFDGY